MIHWLIEEGDEKITPWESLLKQSRSSQEMANTMNKAFLEPLKEHHLSCTITHLALEKDSPEFIEVSEERLWKVLSNLNPPKLVGPDKIPNLLLQEYANLIAFLVCRNLNALFRGQCLPTSWEIADNTPLPKKKPL